MIEEDGYNIVRSFFCWLHIEYIFWNIENTKTANPNWWIIIYISPGCSPPKWGWSRLWQKSITKITVLFERIVLFINSFAVSTLDCTNYFCAQIAGICLPANITTFPQLSCKSPKPVSRRESSPVVRQISRLLLRKYGNVSNWLLQRLPIYFAHLLYELYV